MRVYIKGFFLFFLLAVFFTASCQSNQSYIADFFNEDSSSTEPDVDNNESSVDEIDSSGTKATADEVVTETGTGTDTETDTSAEDAIISSLQFSLPVPHNSQYMSGVESLTDCNTTGNSFEYIDDAIYGGTYGNITETTEVTTVGDRCRWNINSQNVLIPDQIYTFYFKSRFTPHIDSGLMTTNKHPSFIFNFLDDEKTAHSDGSVYYVIGDSVDVTDRDDSFTLFGYRSSNWLASNQVFVPKTTLGITELNWTGFFRQTSYTMFGSFDFDDVTLIEGKWNFGVAELIMPKEATPAYIAVDKISAESGTPTVEVSGSKDGKSYSDWTAVSLTKTTTVTLEETEKSTTRLYFSLSSISEISDYSRIRWRVTAADGDTNLLVSKLGYIGLESKHPRLFDIDNINQNFAYGSDNFTSHLILLESSSKIQITNSDDWIGLEAVEAKRYMTATAFACYQVGGNNYTELSEIPEDNICDDFLAQLWTFMALFPAINPEYYTLGDNFITVNGNIEYTKEFAGDTAEAMALAYDWLYTLINHSVSDVKTHLESRGYTLSDLTEVSDSSVNMRAVTAFYAMMGAYQNAFHCYRQSVYMNHYPWALRPLYYVGAALIGDDLDDLSNLPEFINFQTNALSDVNIHFTAESFAVYLWQDGLNAFDEHFQAIDEVSADGFWWEDMAYGIKMEFEMFWSWIYVYEKLTGESIRDDLKGFSNMMASAPYIIKPDLDFLNIGDMFIPGKNSQWITSFNWAMEAYPEAAGDIANAYLARLEQALGGDEYPWYNYPFRAIAGFVVDDTKDLTSVMADKSTTKVFEDTHTFVSRNNWNFIDFEDDTSTYSDYASYQSWKLGLQDSIESDHNFILFFRTRSQYGAHDSYDNNAVLFWPFLSDGGARDGSDSDVTYNYFRQAIAHNTLIVYKEDEVMCAELDPADDFDNSGGQLEGGSNCVEAAYRLGDAQKEVFNRGELVFGTAYDATDDRGEIVYALADAAKAYHEDKLNAFWRDVIWLKKDPSNAKSYLLIWDRVDTPDASLPRAILFHSEDFLSATGTRYADGESVLTDPHYILGTQFTRYASEVSPETEHGFYMHLNIVYPEAQTTRLLVGDDYAFMAGGIIGANGVLTGSTNYLLAEMESKEKNGVEPSTGRIEVYDKTGEDQSYFLTVGEIVYRSDHSVAIPSQTSISKVANESGYTVISLDDATHQWIVVFSKSLTVPETSTTDISFTYTITGTKQNVFFTGLVPDTSYGLTKIVSEDGKTVTVNLKPNTGDYYATNEGSLEVSF